MKCEQRCRSGICLRGLGKLCKKRIFLRFLFYCKLRSNPDKHHLRLFNGLSNLFQHIVSTFLNFLSPANAACRPESRNIISDFSVVNNYISYGIYSPASGRESDILPFRRSAILTERFCIRHPFTRAIRKLASSMLSAASQLLLLMKRRSLPGTQQADFRASTEQPVWSHE